MRKLALLIVLGSISIIWLWKSGGPIALLRSGVGALRSLLFIVVPSNLSSKDQHSAPTKLEFPCISRSVWLLCIFAATIGFIGSIAGLGLRYSFWNGITASNPVRALIILCFSFSLVWLSSLGRLKDMNGISSVRLLTRIPPIDAVIMGFSSSKPRTNSEAGIGLAKEATIFTFGFLFMEILCLVLLIMFSSSADESDTATVTLAIPQVKTLLATKEENN